MFGVCVYTCGAYVTQKHGSKMVRIQTEMKCARIRGDEKKEKRTNVNKNEHKYRIFGKRWSVDESKCCYGKFNGIEHENTYHKHNIAEYKN